MVILMSHYFQVGYRVIKNSGLITCASPPIKRVTPQVESMKNWAWQRAGIQVDHWVLGSHWNPKSWSLIREQYGQQGNHCTNCKYYNLGQRDPNGFGVGGVCRSIFNENLRNVRGHELRTYILIQNFLIDWKFHFPTNRKVFIYMIFRARGNVEDPLKPLVLTPQALNYST